MKLIVLYGPPAVGKQTVAEELAKQTGIKLFYGHLTWNAVNPIFPWGTDSFRKVLPDIRQIMMTEAARANLDLIFSFVYSPARRHIAEEHYFKSVESNGGTLCLVRLFAPTETREERVSEQSRVDMGKIVSIEHLRSYHEKLQDLNQRIEGRPSLEVDTSKYSPSETAKKIIEHYTLSNNTGH